MVRYHCTVSPHAVQTVLGGLLVKKRSIVIIAATVTTIAVMTPIIFFAVRLPSPLNSKWTAMLAASGADGWISEAASVCALNPRPLTEVIGARLQALRISDSERESINKQFAAGMADIRPMLPPSKKECDRIS